MAVFLCMVHLKISRTNCVISFEQLGPGISIVVFSVNLKMSRFLVKDSNMTAADDRLEYFYAPEGTSGGILKLNRPSICLPSVRPLQIVSQRYLINY